jgi:hypothetical protein
MVGEGACASPTPSPTPTPSGALWYNGDWDFVGYHANEQNTSSSNSMVYDDFSVEGSGGTVTAVFSNN